MNSRIVVRSLIVIGLTIMATTAAYAEHAWSTYHWARQANPMPLQVVDSVSGDWQGELDIALDEWNQSVALNMSITSGDDSAKARKRCQMVSGQMRVCNAAYGFNGWLGLASIGLDSNGHIDRGTAKMNDSYSSYWNDPNEKRHVMCQEIGHVFGLGHTSEDGSSQQTCMDYSSDPQSISPNAHDYQMLADIYAHLDSYDSYAGGSSGGGDPAPCSAPPGKGCNKNGFEGDPPMGVRVNKGHRFETWVAPRPDGGLWIHHLTLVPDESHD